ncbi:MAG: AAA family ATPase [Rhizonema sp. PD37]|nr:AAA family ATPase [Rhizonema sp. PD37]
MTNFPVSPIEALNAAIQSYNPFTNTGIVKEQDVWGKKFPDVPTFNAHASDTVFQAIDLVRSSQSSQDKVTSIAITAQQGVGKTHLLSRIRHRLEREGGAFFIYAGVNNYTDLNLVKYQFQQTLADSLSKIGSQQAMQWQEVAAAMVNEAGSGNLQTPTELVKKFDQAYAKSLTHNKNLMNALQTQVLRKKQNVDPYIVRAILWTLSETQAPFAIKWLSGEELAQSNADALGLPNLSKTSQDREAEALKNIQQILNLVSSSNPVVICFDEIDVKNNSTDDGLPTELVITDLVKRLHDTLENSELSRGVVIITVMLPNTWTNKVNSMLDGTPDRLSKYTQRKPIDLIYIDSDSFIELVTLWLKDFYETRNLLPPHPVYPFEESQLREYGKKRLTVREALKWCAENFKVCEEVFSSDPLERFELALKSENESDIGDYLEDNSLVADVLRFGFQTLKGETLEGETSTGEKLNEVTIEDVTEVEPKSNNQGWINFKVIGEEQGKVFKIGVAVLQHPHGKAVRAGMGRLIEYDKFDITRGCLVRSKEKKIRKQWDSYQFFNQLLNELGGEWVDLKVEDIRPLIDLYSVYQKRDSYQLTEEQIFEFLKPLTIENNLLLEILSNPSGKSNEESVEDDTQIVEDFLNSSNLDETDETDDLGDLFN